MKITAVLFFLLVSSMVGADKIRIVFRIIGSSSPKSTPSTVIVSNLQQALSTSSLNYKLPILNYSVTYDSQTFAGTDQASTTSALESNSVSSRSPSFLLLILASLGVFSFGYSQVNIKSSSILLALLALTFFGGNGVHALGSYSNCKLLNDDVQYKLFWTVENQNSGGLIPRPQIINFAIQAETKGWIAMGFSLNGQMSSGGQAPGSDIFVGYQGAGCPTGCINDYSTVVYDLPKLDPEQDLEFVSSDLTGGVLTIEFRRYLNTSDSLHDLPIALGPNKLLYSTNTNLLPIDNSTFSMHNYWGSLTVDFTQPSLCPTSGDILVEITFDGTLAQFDEDEFISSISNQFNVDSERVVILEVDDEPEPFCPECTIDIFAFKNYSVPAQPTTYVCQAFSFPPGPLRHIIRFDFEVDNQEVLHHMVFFRLNPGFTYPTVPTLCSGMPDDTLPMFAWAPGGEDFILPDEAGFLVGGSEPTIMIMQHHYNNPTSISGLFDSSSLKMYLTTNLRPFNAGTLFLGAITMGISIPPAQPTWHESSMCSFPPTQPLTVFAQMSHMHVIGERLWTQQFRQGVEIDDIGLMMNYDFNGQHFVMINRTIMTGDQLNTHCIWDSTSKNTTTLGGEDSFKEMCLNVILYYPDISLPFCINQVPDGCACDYGQTCLTQPECTTSSRQ